MIYEGHIGHVSERRGFEVRARLLRGSRVTDFMESSEANRRTVARSVLAGAHVRIERDRGRPFLSWYFEAAGRDGRYHVEHGVFAPMHPKSER